MLYPKNTAVTPSEKNGVFNNCGLDIISKFGTNNHKVYLLPKFRQNEFICY